MRKSDRVLVVGTTSDYIERVRLARPDQVVFLTAPAVRRNAKEPRPEAGEEIPWESTEYKAVRKAVKNHLANWLIRVRGVACFDCEAMETAARLAADFGLPYPSVDAVLSSRDKYVCKRIWRDGGIACPLTQPIHGKADVLDFLGRHPKGMVLKPFCGSGSELVFFCQTPEQCEQGFNLIKEGLAMRTDSELFANTLCSGYRMLAEAWIDGPEYSCDFLLDKGRATILRTTRKIKMHDMPFGTASGYALCEKADDGRPEMADLLQKAADLLGIRGGICMVDYILEEGRPVLIEMTPRPGGDCLPYLLEAAGGVDTLGLTIDVAARRPVTMGENRTYEPLVGFRIHAHHGGVLKSIDATALTKEKNVRQVSLIREPGHAIKMPPEDYDSWFLGHVIFMPDGETPLSAQCKRLAELLDVVIE